MTRVLVTNDDGISSPGLRYLAKAAMDAGFEVTVAAPCGESSGSSASITLAEEDGRVHLDERRLVGLEGVPALAVAASPALIALVAVGGAFGDPPDVVLSGINRGANTGRAIVHSGTVGAALTAGANGCSAMAVSLDVGLSPTHPPAWRTAALIARDLFPRLLEADGTVVLNVNVPNVGIEDVQGIEAATLASFGAVQTKIELGDGFIRTTLADPEEDLEPGTDAAWLEAGYATVTSVCTVCEAGMEHGNPSRQRTD